MVELVKYDSDQRQRFPKNLVRLRTERGLSKNKLALRLGWAYNTITAWERGARMPNQYAIEDICEVFGVTKTELLGSPVKLRMFAYYRKGKLTATGTLQEIADQTKQKIDSLRSLLSKSKNPKEGWKTYLVEIKDETRYTIEFTQTFTIDEIERHGLGWLRNNPLVRIEEVKG
nr:MAG TPA: Repressor protein CI [Caudoviricetes sp.]